MASVVTEANGRRLIQLSEGEHTQRPKIRLGKVTKRDAESTRVHIENLLRSKKVGTTIPPATAEWLSKIPDSLRKRIEKYELIDSYKKNLPLFVLSSMMTIFVEAPIPFDHGSQNG